MNIIKNFSTKGSKQTLEIYKQVILLLQRFIETAASDKQMQYFFCSWLTVSFVLQYSLIRLVCEVISGCFQSSARNYLSS